MGLDISLIHIVHEPVNDLCHLFVDDSPELLPVYGAFIKDRVVEAFRDEPKLTVSVYYYEELAHQRKGVRFSFAERYGADEFIFTFVELRELRTHIDDLHLKSFDANFIYNFREGDTIILISS